MFLASIIIAASSARSSLVNITAAARALIRGAKGPHSAAGHLDFKQARVDLLSGLTVALALVPEAVAFAFVCGVSPLVGLYAAFIVSLITSAFGGRPGMISGATGAVAVVVVSLVQTHGIEYLFATVVLAGVIQVLAAVARLGKFIRLVPEAVETNEKLPRAARWDPRSQSARDRFQCGHSRRGGSGFYRGWFADVSSARGALEL
jgi:hypothetical protein